MNITDKIGVLADAAKYDASCSTSGSARANTPGGLGNGAVGGICHAWSADGRCVALLKVLLSNVCAYDCAYCQNRRSNDLRRAAFEPEELVRLIIDFYRRNYIEGAFLSSGVLGCPDATMEKLIWVARTLRTREHFNGYIHLKIIPGASESLVLEAARWADRVSVNIELPSAASLSRIAPDKTPKAIFGPMRTLARAGGFEPPEIAPPALKTSEIATLGMKPLDTFPPAIRTTHIAAATKSSLPSVQEARANRSRNPKGSIIPAGQTTQLVVGASPESDATILGLAENLYLAYDVRRVYYSAYIPTGSDPRLPVVEKPPLAREHRLYQADWLFRFYGFKASEILDATHPFLEARIDPKSSWALRNLGFFPVEINCADYKDLLRVPGIGPTSAQRIVKARRQTSIRSASLSRLGVVMRRARWFITVGGKLPEGDVMGAGISMLGNPDVLKRALLDPAFRQEEQSQPELPWESA
ncbi:MAG: putative DNA modification/repair radical SAM protein [Spirochaetae bacterium HGW-Spirochaetae-9]|nr:MAG: putative DNA modification/repair radical SAM protein [Spirochaetae bacterium HGW-Spirochaetae-9]